MVVAACIRSARSSKRERHSTVPPKVSTKARNARPSLFSRHQADTGRMVNDLVAARERWRRVIRSLAWDMSTTGYRSLVMSDQHRGIRVRPPCESTPKLVGSQADVQPFADLLSSPTSPPAGWIHPIRLAASLPWSSCLPVLAFFSRRHAHIPMTAPHWSHVFLIAVQSLVTIASPSTSTSTQTLPAALTPRTPSSVWGLSHKWITAYLKRTDIVEDQSKTACRLITGMVAWTDEVIRIRGEVREAWYRGPEWREVAGLWIDLARNVRTLC